MMLALALLASHLVGDFIFQSRWMSDRKLVDARVRHEHVFTYCLAFAPVLVWRGQEVGSGHVAVFGVLLYVLHFLTDSRRFSSTLGDVVAWRRLSGRARGKAWRAYYESAGRGQGPRPTYTDSHYMRWPPPNPWPPLPIIIDQTLHIVQIAALGWLLI